MVDIHSHILWDVDDGAQTMEESVAMLAAAGQSGTTDIVATPHHNPTYSYQAEVVAARIAQLGARNSDSPKLHRGCEFHLTFDHFDALLDRPSAYTINGGPYLLLEIPDFHIGKHTDSILRRLADSQIIPIVAHPERNPTLRQDPKRLENWVEMGCLLQLTALSITGGFGASARTAGAMLLERGLVHMVASDAHDATHRTTSLGEAFHIVTANFGKDAADVLFTENPGAAVRGARLPGGRQLTWQRRRPWYRLWKPRTFE